MQVEIEGVEEQEVKQEDQGEGSQLEVSGDQAQPGSATIGIEQEEETREGPAGESHPSVPADDESAESLQKPSVHHESLESEVGSSTSIQPQHKEVVDGVIQEQRAGAEEQELGRSPPSAVQSQTLEAADIKQEHIE